MSVLKIKKINEDVIIPKRSTKGSAGFDLYAYIPDDECIIIKPGEFKNIRSGISLQFPCNIVCLVCGRSGLSQQRVTVLQGSDIIDSDFRGEVSIPIINDSGSDFIINRGDRIAQLLFLNCVTDEFDIVEELDSTERGNGSFGSTGI